MKNFFVTLPSNIRGTKNTPGKFTVRLPKPIVFSSNWEVALSEILYTASWGSLVSEDSRFITVTLVDGSNHSIEIPKGSFSTPHILANLMTTKISQHDFLSSQNKQSSEFLQNYMDYLVTVKTPSIVVFNYDDVERRFVCSLNHRFVKSVKLSDELGYITGFDNKIISERRNIALHDVCARGVVDKLYIYCNIIQEQYVGDCLANLLRICAAKGTFGENVHETFIAPHFCELITKEISEITVEIRTSTGEIVPFEFGSTIAVLEFRKRLFI